MEFNPSIAAIVKDELIISTAKQIAEWDTTVPWSECAPAHRKSAEALAEDLLTRFALRYISAMGAVSSACDTFRTQALLDENYVLAHDYKTRAAAWDHVAHTMSHWTKGSDCNGD